MSKFNKTAYYVDEGDVILKGYKDKYGFHPNKNIHCGFDLQKLKAKDLGTN